MHSPHALDEDGKGVNVVETLGGPQMVSTVTEPGLYKLIAKSRRPQAREFDRWVRYVVITALSENRPR